MNENITVRRAAEGDLQKISLINSVVFLGDRDRLDSALEWANCWFRAFPMYQYFVIEVDGEVAGYAGWQVHGGFHRAEPAIELEQLGIDRKYQGRKLAEHFQQKCISELVKWMQQKNDRIESHVAFVVWGDTFNFNAMGVYAKIFTDGVSGFRKQFGNRAENMLRVRVPLIRPVRDE